MDHERAALESRYHALLALARDESTSWHGIEHDRLTGDWSGFTRREARLTSERDQARMFGRVLLSHDGRLDTLEGDETPVAVPTTRPCHPAAGPDAPDSPAAGGHASPSGGTDQTGQASREVERNIHELAIMAKIQLDVLGSLPGGAVKVFSLFHRRTEVIRDVGKMTFETLLRVAGPSVKEHVFKSGEAARNAEGYSFSEAREAIALLSGYRTIGEQTELGVGVWEGEADQDGEPSCVLVGVGEAAYWNGDRKLHRIDYPRAKGHLLDFESGETVWYDHAVLAGLLERCEQDQKWREDTLAEVVALFQQWRWRHDQMAPVVAAGLAFATFVQSFWNWRPQVAIIGPSNSGKSFLWGGLERIFGALCIKASKPTAAGIRQAIGCTSKIVIVDEFEQEKHRAEILEMLRASSRGDKILRGTTNQKGQEFRLRHIAWVAAIEVGLRREPDRNRFIMLELLKPLPEKRGKLVLPPASELADLGQRMLAIAIHSIARARDLAELLKDTRVEGVNDRVVESHAVPVAMLAAIHRMDDLAARELLREVLVEVGRDEPEAMADEYSLMSDILSASMNVKGSRRSVGQLLEIAIREVGTSQREAEELLETCGLRMVRLHDGKFLAIAHRIVADQILKGTEWAGQSINQILRRIPGCVLSRQRMGGQNPRCIMVPEQYLADELMGGDQLGSLDEARQQEQQFV